MTPNEVMSGYKSPGTVQARALLCFWGHRKLGLTTIKISEKIGVCQSALSRLTMGEIGVRVKLKIFPPFNLSFNPCRDYAFTI
jgi:hypothetical protein